MMWCVCTDVLTHVCVWKHVLSGLFRFMAIFVCKIELAQIEVRSERIWCRRQGIHRINEGELVC